MGQVFLSYLNLSQAPIKGPRNDKPMKAKAKEVMLWWQALSIDNFSNFRRGQKRRRQRRQTRLPGWQLAVETWQRYTKRL